MRILLAATRSIISFATSLHIHALRVGVWLEDRKVSAAILATDAADVAADAAKAAYHAAQALAAEASSFEGAVIRESANYRMAAQAEADRLRRGVIL